LCAKKENSAVGQEQGRFKTFRGYSLEEEEGLTPSMEDYLEMLYRIASEKGYVRLNDLSTCLNVQPSSATRMMQRLAEQGLVEYEPYGLIHLTKEGAETGSVLLERHNLLEQFLMLLGAKENILRDTERMEHIISPELVERIRLFVLYASRNPDWLSQFSDWAGQ
jgi:DtxR family Mn-dependent transcriptional regulator